MLRTSDGLTVEELPERGADPEWPFLRIRGDRLYFFTYSQDGTKVPWCVANTNPNRQWVNWLQVHDAPPA